MPFFLGVGQPCRGMGLEFDSFENDTKFKVQPLDGKSTVKMGIGEIRV